MLRSPDAEAPGELFFLVLEEHEEALVIDFELFGVPEVVVGLHDVLAAADREVELAQDQRDLELVFGEGGVELVGREAILFLPFVFEILRDKRAEFLEEHVSHGLILANPQRSFSAVSRPSRCQPRTASGTYQWRRQAVTRKAKTTAGDGAGASPR